MSETINEDYGSGQSSEEENSHGQISYSEALVEWRSSDQVENGSPLTSPPYWDINEFGSKHSELYGKHTWKIEKYSEMYKPALRSDVFDAGAYKWYILIYPEACGDCDYISLYLCLTNHEDLLPGWSHFVQYTLALMNKDPKKSIYLDSVDRFSKKNDSRGWNNFIELRKLQDGYIDDLDSLIIKAKVQVISERVDRPLRCLSSQYRRELVRVYLPNVENIFLHFIDMERTNFFKLMQNKEEWQSFISFWLRLDKKTRREMSRDKMDVVLNLAAKMFFLMERGTSTLMMDSLYSGWKAIEGQTKKKKSRKRQMDNVELPAVPAPIVSVDEDMFVLEDDLLILMQKTVIAPFHIKDSKMGNVGEEYSKEAIERDESRLAEVGRRAMEILALSRIYSNKVCFAYKEHIALMRQEELIHEEEEEWLAASKKKAKGGITEKERKSKKKQAKQKKNKKEKRKEERLRSQTEERDTEKEESVRAKTESSAEKPDTLGESSIVHCELVVSEIHQPPSEDTSIGRSSSLSLPNEVAETKYTSVYPDESVQSDKGNVSNWQSMNWRRKGKTPARKISGANSLATETGDQPSRHASNPKSQIHSSETRRVGGADVVIKEAHNPRKHNPVSKDRGKVQTQEKSAAVFSPPKASPWNLPSAAQAKPEKRGVFNVDTVPNRKAISAGSPLSDQESPSGGIQFQTVGSRAAVQNTTSPIPSMSRPLCALTILPKQDAPSVSAARSVNSPGRVSAPTYVPQSYKHAVVGSLSSDHPSSQWTGTSALFSVSNQSGFPVNVGSEVSSRELLRTCGSSSNSDTTATPISGNQRMNVYNTPVSTSMRQNDVQIGRAAHILMTDDFPHLGIINDLFEEGHGLMNTSGYRLPQWLNDVYSFLADLGISARFRRSRDDGFHQSYGEYMSGSSSSPSFSLYGSGQMDGLNRQTQWQSANMDLSLLAMRSQNNASEFTYFNFDVYSSNPNLSARINGYRAFRPSNGN